MTAQQTQGSGVLPFSSPRYAPQGQKPDFTTSRTRYGQFEVHSVAEEIDAIMVWHPGEKKAITAQDLFSRVRDAGWDVQTVASLRNTIHDMRQAGYLIASGQVGYWLPVTREEAFEYVNEQFRVPARDQLYTARRQRQAAINIFGGQTSFLKGG